MRREAIEAVGICRCTEAVKALSAVALKSEGGDGKAAVMALRQIGTDAARKSLEDLQKRVKKGSMREAVSAALDAIETVGVKE